MRVVGRKITGWSAVLEHSPRAPRGYLRDGAIHSSRSHTQLLPLLEEIALESEAWHRAPFLSFLGFLFLIMEQEIILPRKILPRAVN